MAVQTCAVTTRALRRKWFFRGPPIRLVHTYLTRAAWPEALPFWYQVFGLWVRGKCGHLVVLGRRLLFSTSFIGSSSGLVSF